MAQAGDVQGRVERQLQEYDASLDQAGRKGPERLTAAERGHLMGIAIAWALVWGVVAEVITIAAMFVVGASDWWGLANGPIVAAVYFAFKRRSLLNRAAEMAAATRRRLGEQLASDDIRDARPER